MVKRTVDVVLSAVLLLVAAPILLLAAFAILITSPGPVLFRQTRMGRNFRPFQILKLRTMAHAEGGLAYTLGPDPRITAVGRLLRRTKIDELPQLWNVLRGEMSLVGPRPVLPELTREFHDSYAFLLRARPGLTDPASLKYSQETRLLGRAPNPMQFFKTVVTPDKIRLSFEYMRDANLFTDLATLFMTAVVCLAPAASRLYGKEPEILPAGEAPPVPVLLSSRYALRAQAATPQDESIFSFERARREAAAELDAQREPLPWIPPRVAEFRSRSVSSGAKGSASR